MIKYIPRPYLFSKCEHKLTNKLIVQMSKCPNVTKCLFYIIENQQHRYSNTKMVHI